MIIGISNINSFNWFVIVWSFNFYRTVKVGCPGFIRLVADEKAGGCQLRISSLRLDHSNHPVGPEVIT